MNKTRTTLMMVGLAAAGLLSGFLFNQWRHQQQTEVAVHTAAEQIGLPEFRPDFALQDLDDKLRQAKEWDGKVLMVNFWATWCPPCRKEIPAFIELQDKYRAQGFQIIGIALDNKQAVVDFVDPMGVNYPVLLAEQDGIPLTKAYGNRLGVLPYTVIINRQGKIIHVHRNELKFEQAESLIKPLL